VIITDNDAVYSDPSINLYVGDVEASVRFYTAFGFTEEFRTPASGPPAHVELRLGGLRLGLAAVEAAHEMHGLVRGSGPCGEVALWTDDVDLAYERALAAGAPSVSAPHDFLDGRLRAAWVGDPDGNPVQFVRRRA
jgi:catechol 2,3-dioxygenase-like lactoylglutathione lyase family enzyme